MKAATDKIKLKCTIVIISDTFKCLSSVFYDLTHHVSQCLVTRYHERNCTREELQKDTIRYIN